MPIRPTLLPLAALLALALAPAAPAHAQPAAASAPASAAAPGPRSAGALADMMAGRLKSQCDAARTAVDLAHTPQERALLADDTDLACECLPSQVAAALGPDREAPLEPAQFLARLRTALDTCGARGIRRSIARACERGLDPTSTSSEPAAAADARQRAHCDCMRDGLARLDDAALARDAQDAYRRFGERAKARAAGASEPVFPPGPLQRLQQACVAQDAPAR
jgi:hypothetical protein